MIEKDRELIINGKNYIVFREMYGKGMTKPDIEAHQYYLFTEKEMKVAKARGDNMHSEIEIAKQSQPYGRLIKTFRLGDY